MCGSSLHARFSIPITTVARDARTPLSGITAFPGDRETSLWFFVNGAGSGIFTDGHPADVWAV